MSAYVIVEIEVRDPERYERYKSLAEATVTQFGGRYIVRGGPAALLEGGPPPRRVVVLEFADSEQAKRWWESPEYGPAKALRQEVATTRMVLVEGV